MERSTIQPRTPAGARAEVGRSGSLLASGRARTILIMAATATAILIAAILSNRPASATGITPIDLAGIPSGPAPIVGQPAPDFSATTVDGNPVRLSELKGSVVWLTFGASWCQPCRAENPDIKASYEAFRDRGVVVVQVYITESAATVAEYAGRLGLAYVKVADTDDSIATNYRILGIPAHFFIDRDGVLRQLRVGTLDAAAMQAILTELAG